MTATYSLEEIKELVRIGSFVVTRRSQEEALDLFNLDEQGVAEEVLGLELIHFKKTMASREKPGLFQDVYKKKVNGIDAYIKLQIDKSNAIVISFHEYT